MISHPVVDTICGRHFYNAILPLYLVVLFLQKCDEGGLKLVSQHCKITQK